MVVTRLVLTVLICSFPLSLSLFILVHSWVFACSSHLFRTLSHVTGISQPLCSIRTTEIRPARNREINGYVQWYLRDIRSTHLVRS